MRQIRIEQLNVSFGERHVLTDVDIVIEKGQFVSILGPNGSGKTTLLRNLTGAVKRDSGMVYLENEDVLLLKARERARQFSVVPQSTEALYEFTVLDVVKMGRYPYIQRFLGEQDEDRKAVESAMEKTNTLCLSGRLFTQLSGGERQRVILAQALAQEPKVILLDEPISNLDPQYQTQILDTIKALCKERELTAIAVLHDLNLAAMYSDLVVMLKAGKVVKMGSVQEVLTRENVEKVFETQVYVSGSPIIDGPHIYMKSQGFYTRKKKKIHVICGGGSGSDLLHKLSYSGYILSAGALNEGDRDWQTAKDAEVTFSSEKPFATISEKSYEGILKQAESASCILLCPTYFSSANVANLRVLLEPCLKDKAVFVLEAESYSERNFAGALVDQVYAELSARKNCYPVDKATLLTRLEQERI